MNLYNELIKLGPDCASVQDDDIETEKKQSTVVKIVMAGSSDDGPDRQGTRRVGILRTFWDLFLPGEVMLADRLMCIWTEMVMLRQRGVDCVCRLTSHHKADFHPQLTGRF